MFELRCTRSGILPNNALDYSVHISNTVLSEDSSLLIRSYVLYNIGKDRYKLTFTLTK